MHTALSCRGVPSSRVAPPHLNAIDPRALNLAAASTRFAGGLSVCKLPPALWTADPSSFSAWLSELIWKCTAQMMEQMTESLGGSADSALMIQREIQASRR